MEKTNWNAFKGCLTLIVAAIILFVLVIFLLSLGGNKNSGTPSGKPATSTAAASTTAPEKSIGDVVLALESQVREKFDKSNVFVQDNIIIAQVWIDGTTETAMTAMGDESLAKQWAEMAESMRTTSEQTKAAIDASGNTDYHIAYYLMNDQNDDNFLISTLDDTLMYDAVSGVNLLGTDE